MSLKKQTFSNTPCQEFWSRGIKHRCLALNVVGHPTQVVNIDEGITIMVKGGLRHNGVFVMGGAECVYAHMLAV